MSDEIVSLRKSLGIYRGLVEVSGLINSITDYDELLRAVLEVARRVVQAEAASLFIRSEVGGDHLDLVIATSGEGGFVQPKIRVEAGQGIAGWVFERGESQLISTPTRTRGSFAAPTNPPAFARSPSFALRSSGMAPSSVCCRC